MESVAGGLLVSGLVRSGREAFQDDAENETGDERENETKSETEYKTKDEQNAEQTPTEEHEGDSESKDEHEQVQNQHDSIENQSLLRQTPKEKQEANRYAPMMQDLAEAYIRNLGESYGKEKVR